jgi:hypothetical protein
VVAQEAESSTSHWSRLMAKIAAQITIGDYAKWRAVFDKAASLREKAGVKNVQVYRDTGNPNALLVWSEVDDLTKVRGMYDSPELRNAMREAGVVGAPNIHLVPDSALLDEWSGLVETLLGAR